MRSIVWSFNVEDYMMMVLLGLPISRWLGSLLCVSEMKLAPNVRVISLMATRSGPVRLSLTRASTC